MHTGLEDDPKHFHRLTAYFAERARGGVGPDRHRRLRAQHRGLGRAVLRAAHDAARPRAKHRPITDAVHAEGGKIALQILHTGRYGYHPLAVAPSRLKSPISPFTPRALSARGVERQIRGFVRCATLAREAGYDGVEVMGSEGYFINQFLARAHQPAHRRVGRQLREPHAPAGGDRRAHARGRRPRLHHRLPALDARPRAGRQHLGRGRARSRRPSSAPAPRSSTPASAGTRRASRPSPPRCRAPRSRG